MMSEVTLRWDLLSCPAKPLLVYSLIYYLAILTLSSGSFSVRLSFSTPCPFSTWSFRVRLVRDIFCVIETRRYNKPGTYDSS